MRRLASGAGEFRGWADRLALLLAHAGERTEPLLYANLAVRSRTIPDVLDRQIPRAIELGADLATILIGGNDMSQHASSAADARRSLGPGIADCGTRAATCCSVTPFIPPNPFLRLLHDRTAALSREFRRIGAETGARVLDVAEDPGHLRSAALGRRPRAPQLARAPRALVRRRRGPRACRAPASSGLSTP